MNVSNYIHESKLLKVISKTLLSSYMVSTFH
jgi:hypothetical protein